MYEKEIEESGFYDGVEISTPEDVIAYFTVENMKSMFSGECAWSQETLDAMCNEVLKKPLFTRGHEKMEIFKDGPQSEFMAMTEVGGFFHL